MDDVGIENSSVEEDSQETNANISSKKLHCNVNSDMLNSCETTHERHINTSSDNMNSSDPFPDGFRSNMVSADTYPQNVKSNTDSTDISLEDIESYKDSNDNFSEDFQSNTSGTSTFESVSDHSLSSTPDATLSNELSTNENTSFSNKSFDKTENKKIFGDLLSINGKTNNNNDPITSTASNQVDASCNMTTTLSKSSHPPLNYSFHKDSSDQIGDSDEEYFEEFHLPNTHENAFVRHLSFRRKVKSTDINAPDAERIEGLVRTGEFVRHGSIRKRIVPSEEIIEEEINEGKSFETANLNITNLDNEQIDSLIEVENHVEDNFFSDSLSELWIKRPLKRHTSTPRAIDKGIKNCKASACDNENSDLSLSQNTEENIEDGTIQKIQSCLDFSAYRDVLNLSGRLSDILSPKEMEEVLINSERYRKFLNSEVFEALSISYQGQTQSLPYHINTSVNNFVQRSAINSSKLKNNLDSQSNSPQSLAVIDSGISSPKTTNPKTSKNELRLVRRPSIPFDGIAAPGIFLECESSSNQNLRKIPAPEIDLNTALSSKEEESDSDFESQDSTNIKRHIISATNKVLISSDGFHYEGNCNSSYDEEEGYLEDCHEVPSSTLSQDTGNSEVFPPLPPPDLIPELMSAGEFSEIHHWRDVVIGGAWRRIDMKAVAPYRKCVSDGGFMDGSENPIVVLTASLLPDRSRKDYHYIMDNLFMYVLSFVEQLSSDDYVLVYFSYVHQNWAGPGFHWMKRAYDMIDRKLRKNMKTLYVVHPTLWSKTVFTLCRPFISSKFSRKLHYVPNLIELSELVPLEQIHLPDSVKQADFEVMMRERKTKKNKR